MSPIDAPNETARQDAMFRASSWVEVDLDAISANARAIGDGLAPPCQLMAVVKSNAYGHGLELVTDRLYRDGVRWFGVNTLDEGVAVRDLAPESRVLVMGYVAPVHYPIAATAGLDLTVTNVDDLAAASPGLRIHLKVETGTHRRGILRDDWSAAASAAASRGVEVAGVSMHFANIEDTLNHAFAEEQLRTFEEAAAVFTSGTASPLRHTACTAAALLFPATHFDLARAGIGLYGMWPSRETRLSATSSEIALVPALTWKTRITQVTHVPAGVSVGYGRTYTTPAPSRLAVLPVGYFEGYVRSLSGSAYAWIDGTRAPVRGRVCMNMCMIDVTHAPGAEVGSEVVLLGGPAEATGRITAEEMADWAGTIHYEIVSRIHPDIPRIAG